MFVAHLTSRHGKSADFAIVITPDIGELFEPMTSGYIFGLTGCIWIIPGSYELVA